MIAMASIHEETEVCESQGTSPETFNAFDARQRYAAHHAQLAMSELSKILADRPEATEVAMINCVLFVLLDYMVGNFASAYSSNPKTLFTLSTPSRKQAYSFH